MLAELPDEMVAGWSLAIAARLSALDEWRDAQTVHTYVGSLPGEVRTAHVIVRALEERRSVICPRTRPHGQLNHRELTSLTQLHRGPFGVSEPDPELTPPADPNDAELIVVPGVGFGLDGSRLGVGGGYYDRFLAGRSATRVALAFEAQIAPTMPRSAHDQMVDLILTELRVIRCQ